MIHPLPDCLACGAEIKPEGCVLDLWNHPPANLLLDSPSYPYPTYPLALYRCSHCGHGQLSHAVDARELFGSGYSYASGTGGALNKYFYWLAGCLPGILPKSARILEIACNDGSLLHQLSRYGYRCSGVEPDERLAIAARQYINKDESIHEGFWPEISNHVHLGSFDCIIGLNVIGHTESPRGFLAATSHHLNDGAFVLLQTSQVDMLATGQLDTIYAEHISYFTVSSMAALANHFGFRLIGIYDVAVHGRSRIWILERNYYTKTSLSERQSKFEVFRKGEFACSGRAIEYGTPANYHDFGAASHKKISEVRTMLTMFQQAGQPVILFGAAAKAITMFRACEVVPDVVVDEGVGKINKWIPEWNKQVQSPTVLCSHFIGRCNLEHAIVVVGAWNVQGLERKAVAYAERPLMVYRYFPESSLRIVSPD